MFPVSRCTSLAAILVVACGYGSAVRAQQSPGTYPSKPVKIVIPLGPGNSIEIATRLVAEKLTGALGQPFVIEAQPGAAGQIGTERVARSLSHAALEGGDVHFHRALPQPDELALHDERVRDDRLPQSEQGLAEVVPSMLVGRT